MSIEEIRWWFGASSSSFKFDSRGIILYIVFSLLDSNLKFIVCYSHFIVKWRLFFYSLAQVFVLFCQPYPKKGEVPR